MKKIWLLLLLSMPLGLFSQEKGSEIVIGENSDAGVLNPLTNFSATGSYVNEYLFFSLLRVDKRDFNWLPLIAADLPQVDASGLSFTYTLDPEARWNSGKPITPEDVVFSLKMVKNPFTNNMHSRSAYDNVVSASVTGNNQVTIKLANPSPHGLRATGGFPILNQKYFDPDNSTDDISVKVIATGKLNGLQKESLQKVASKINIFGTNLVNYDVDAAVGPYVLTNWEKNKEIELTYNKKFFGRRHDQLKNGYFAQNFETIRVKIRTDETALRSLIFNGEVDVVPSLSQALYWELSEIPKLADMYDFHTMPGVSYSYIGLNMRPQGAHRKHFFDNPLTRKAVAHLLYVDRLLQDVAYGLGERIASDYPVGNKDYRNPNLDPLEYNQGTARALLAAAGWADSDDDGILDREVDGTLQKFEIEIVYNENNPERGKIAENVKKQFEEVGIKVITKPMPLESYVQRLNLTNFDMMIGAWVQEPNEDSYIQLWHSKQWKGGSNWVGFGDDATDKAIEEYESTVDPTERKNMAHKIQAMIYAEQPYIFLWAPFQTVVIRKRFENAEPVPVRPGFWVGDWEI